MPGACCSSNRTWLKSQGSIAIKTFFIVATMALKPDTANQVRELEKKFKNDMHSLIDAGMEKELKKTGRLCEQDPYVWKKQRLRIEYHENLQSSVQKDKPGFVLPLGFLTIGRELSKSRPRSRSRSRSPIGEVPGADKDKVIKRCELINALGWRCEGAERRKIFTNFARIKVSILFVVAANHQNIRNHKMIPLNRGSASDPLRITKRASC